MSYMALPQMENLASTQFAAITPQAGLVMSAPQDLSARLNAPGFRQRMHYVSSERREAFFDQTSLVVQVHGQPQRISARHCMQLGGYAKIMAMEAFEAFVMRSTKAIWCFTCLQGNVIVPASWAHDNCPPCQRAQTPSHSVRTAPSLAGPANRASFSTPPVAAPLPSPAMMANTSGPTFASQRQSMPTSAATAGPVKIYNFNERSADTMGHKSWNAMNRPSYQSPAVQSPINVASGAVYGQWQTPAMPNMGSGPAFTTSSGMMPPSPVFTSGGASPTPAANKFAMPGNMHPLTPQGFDSAKYAAYLDGQLTPPTLNAYQGNAFGLPNQRISAPRGPFFDPSPGSMTPNTQKAPAAASGLGLGLGVIGSQLVGNKRKALVEVVDLDAETPRKRKKTSFPAPGQEVIDVEADEPIKRIGSLQQNSDGPIDLPRKNTSFAAPDQEVSDVGADQLMKRIDSVLSQKPDQIVDLTRKTPPIGFPNVASTLPGPAVAAAPTNAMPPPPPPTNNRPKLSLRDFGPKWMQQLPGMEGMLKGYIERCMQRAGEEVEAYIKKHHALPPPGKFDEEKEKTLDNWFRGSNYIHQRKVAAAKKAGPPKPATGFKMIQLPDAEDGMPQYKPVALTVQEQLEQQFGAGAEVREDGTVLGPAVTDPAVEGYRPVLATHQQEWYTRIETAKREAAEKRYDWSEEKEAEFAAMLQAEVGHLPMPPRENGDD